MKNLIAFLFLGLIMAMTKTEIKAGSPNTLAYSGSETKWLVFEQKKRFSTCEPLFVMEIRIFGVPPAKEAIPPLEILRANALGISILRLPGSQSFTRLLGDNTVVPAVPAYPVPGVFIWMGLGPTA